MNHPSAGSAPDDAGAFRRAYRRVYWARTDLPRWRELARIRTLVYLGGGGIGDSLNCSAVVHELNRREPGSVSLMTPHPELYRGDPGIRSLHAYDYGLVESLRRWQRRVVHPVYRIPQEQPPRVPMPADHVVAQLCRSAGLTGGVDLRPYYHFQTGEKERFASYAGAVVVQSSCLNARHTLPAKNWPIERMQQVVDALRPHHRLVQTGHRDDLVLRGVEDLRGTLALREVAALLAQARFFVGLVGFLMHLARAVGTRAVIVYGGREHPLQSGYVANENLVGVAACAPCGIDDECRIGHGCMQQILPAHVLAAVGRLETRLGASLETAAVSLD